MTDARLPERWLSDRRFRHLPDGAFRTYAWALLNAVSNTTEGHVSPDDLEAMRRPVDDAEVLVIAGLWDVTADGTGWTVVDFRTTQTTKAELDAAVEARQKDRERKAKQRAKRPTQLNAVPPDKGPVHPDVPTDTEAVPLGLHRLGQASARPGQARRLEQGNERNGSGSAHRDLAAQIAVTAPWPVTPAPVPAEDANCLGCLGWSAHAPSCPKALDVGTWTP